MEHSTIRPEELETGEDALQTEAEGVPTPDDGPDNVAAALMGEVIDGLASAWTTFQLYPNPLEQPAFHRVAETMRSVGVYPLHAEVLPSGFTSDSGPVPTTRDGVERLARRMFTHNVAALKVVGPPTDDEILKLLGILAREPDDIRSSGGAQALLAGNQVEAFELVQRAMLVEAEEAGDRQRDPELAAVLAEGADPERFAASLLAEFEGDPDRLVERFSAWYADLYGRVAETDVSGREDLVRTFVETFFYLPEEFQVPLVAHVLLLRSEVPFQVFLDQFSGHELAGFAPRLTEGSRHELEAYSRLASDTADGRPEELLALLQTAAEVQDARRAVADRVATLLADAERRSVTTGESFLNLAQQLPSREDEFDVGLDVLRQLLATEERDLRFRRVLRIWAGKVGGSVRSGNLFLAREWLDAVLITPTYPSHREPEVAEALGAMATPEVIGALVEQLDDPDKAEAGARLLESWGSPVTDKLVEYMADEEDPARRRLLIDLLVRVSGRDHTRLLKHVKDERWYVVRNLATVLGKTGRPEVAPRLASLATSHHDHRVRVEALRSLALLPGDSSLEVALKALGDEHQRVRQAAVTVLRNSERESAEELLASVAMDGKLPLDVRLRIIEVLGARSKPAGLAVLENLAAAKFAIGKAKAVRDAARGALGGRYG